MTDSAQALLTVQDLTRHFGGVRAVDGASFSVADRSVTALIGPNGAGKTSAFNLLTGFNRPQRGLVQFAGCDIAGRPPHAIARLGMVRTFQITKALAAMTVLDNAMLAAPGQPGE